MRSARFHVTPFDGRTKGGKYMHVLKRVVGFVMRRRRLSIAVVVALLLVVPLAFTRDGEVFVLNALGIGIAVVMVRQLAKLVGGRRLRDR